MDEQEYPPSEFPMGHSYTDEEAVDEVRRWLGRGNGSPHFYGSFKLVAHAGRIVRLELIVSRRSALTPRHPNSDNGGLA